ncbi:MAG: ribosome recycling factor [Alphaproteobacteria bacterium]|nr:ribosome recycling factor [Alphaproteobacteria bacterium]
MSWDQIKSDMQSQMQKAEEALKKDFAGLRTGRASTALLDGLMVEAYGSVVPLNQVGNVSVPDARTLSISVWDKSLIKSVEKAITEANLGLNPMNDGQLIRIPIPPLSEERRVELVKVAARFTEDVRVAVRNHRREALDALKAIKESMSEDDYKRYEKEVQDLTDKAIATLDEMLKNKETEIKQV